MTRQPQPQGKLRKTAITVSLLIALLFMAPLGAGSFHGGTAFGVGTYAKATCAAGAAEAEAGSVGPNSEASASASAEGGTPNSNTMSGGVAAFTPPTASAGTGINSTASASASNDLPLGYASATCTFGVDPDADVDVPDGEVGCHSHETHAVDVVYMGEIMTTNDPDEPAWFYGERIQGGTEEAVAVPLTHEFTPYTTSELVVPSLTATTWSLEVTFEGPDCNAVAIGDAF